MTRRARFRSGGNCWSRCLPALGLLVWFGVARGLRPLADLGWQVAQREPDRLETLNTDGVPEEARPLVASLNRLFGRVTRVLESERRFTADAAHELRTPLAALRTQAQVARAATGDAERRHALDNVFSGCDRATHLLQQLLTLARLESGYLAGGKEKCNLHHVAKAVIAELAPMALTRQVEIELADAPAADIVGYPGLIAILLRNLIDNAVRYSSDGGTVRVEARVSDGAASLSVSYEGPGISPTERSNVGQRFYRILGSGETGSGLGLSIVKHIVTRLGGTVKADNRPSGGAIVTVRLPLKRSEASAATAL